MHLYVITRQDLSAGRQATQSAHAALSFSFEHQSIFRSWHEDSQYLVLLSVPDEPALDALVARAADLGLATTAFREPDLDDSLTAIAIEPSPDTRALLADLPLTLREVSGTVMAG